MKKYNCAIPGKNFADFFKLELEKLTKLTKKTSICLQKYNCAIPGQTFPDLSELSREKSVKFYAKHAQKCYGKNTV